MSIKNQTQLITYPDSMGGDLQSLHHLLRTHFLDVFPGGVHILPPFPSSGDRGFAPRTYFEVDPAFGSWEDIRRIGEHFPVLVDLMVNHISRESPYFQDFARRGRRSEYAGLFITLDKIWPGGEPAPEDIAKIFLRRPLDPFVDITIEETGELERVWATFGTRDWSEQIDIDVNSPEAKKLIREILDHMGKNGVRIVRLDAIAYVTKKRGTSCFFVEPEIYTFLDWIRAEAQHAGIELLPEVHAHHTLQARLAEHGFWVYDFVLPLLVLHTFFNRSARELGQHLRTCPRRQFTMLDCHDGIPVLPDIEDVLDQHQARRVVDICMARGANLSRIFSPGHQGEGGFDAHQINCTYYSALGADPDAYLAARAIQFFSPGVPQVYYTGLLAGENEPGEVERTGEKRAINRKNYSVGEVEQALKKPVVGRLLALIRFRNQHPAFNGEFSVVEAGDEQLVLEWAKDEAWCRLSVNLEAKRSRIEYLDEAGEKQQYIP